MSSPLFMEAPFSGRLLLLLCGRVAFAYPPIIQEPKPLAIVAFRAGLAERTPWGCAGGGAPHLVQAPREGAWMGRDNRNVSNSSQVVPRAPAAFDRAHTSLPLGPSSPLILRLFHRQLCVGGCGGFRPVTIPLQHLQGEGVGLYLAMSSLNLLSLAKVVECLVRYQEHQHLVLAPKVQGAIQPPPLDALTL